MSLVPHFFFNQNVIKVAKGLLGKIIRFKDRGHWLAAIIIETEAYELKEKGSHASLGMTPSRKALFMPPGTIYMYYARGGDSLNISCLGAGNAVLVKSGYYFQDQFCYDKSLDIMMKNNPIKGSTKKRSVDKLCSGQTLLCQSMGIRVSDWDGNNFDRQSFFIDHKRALQPTKIIVTKRLGIPKNRDEHLFYRFIHYDYAPYCTQNPLTKKTREEGKTFFIEETPKN